jgi:hypothetical protein
VVEPSPGRVGQVNADELDDEEVIIRLLALHARQ